MDVQTKKEIDKLTSDLLIRLILKVPQGQKYHFYFAGLIKNLDIAIKDPEQFTPTLHTGPSNKALRVVTLDLWELLYRTVAMYAGSILHPDLAKLREILPVVRQALHNAIALSESDRA